MALFFTVRSHNSLIPLKIGDGALRKSARKRQKATFLIDVFDHQVRRRPSLTLLKRETYHESETALVGRREFFRAIALGGERGR